MADTPMIGEIRMFAGNFAPLGWALCNGQLLSIAGNDFLFTLIGTTYGGDGQTNFALPDLRGRVPIHDGLGAGLSSYVQGQTGGTEQVTLNVNQMPAHNHVPQCLSTAGTSKNPKGQVWAADGGGSTFSYSSTANNPMAAGALGVAGGSQPHDNVQPYLGINFIIALVGLFPVSN